MCAKHERELRPVQKVIDTKMVVELSLYIYIFGYMTNNKNEIHQQHQQHQQQQQRKKKKNNADIIYEL